MNSNRVYINTINAKDEFTLPGEHTHYICERRHTEGNMTSVVARIKGEGHLPHFEFIRWSLSTVDLIGH